MQETDSCDGGTEAQNILASVAATHPGFTRSYNCDW